MILYRTFTVTVGRFDKLGYFAHLIAKSRAWSYDKLPHLKEVHEEDKTSKIN
jgi:hypothetical protein